MGRCGPWGCTVVPHQRVPLLLHRGSQGDWRGGLGRLGHNGAIRARGPGVWGGVGRGGTLTFPTSASLSSQGDWHGGLGRLGHNDAIRARGPGLGGWARECTDVLHQGVPLLLHRGAPPGHVVLRPLAQCDDGQRLGAQVALREQLLEVCSGRGE